MQVIRNIELQIRDLHIKMYQNTCLSIKYLVFSFSGNYSSIFQKSPISQVTRKGNFLPEFNYHVIAEYEILFQNFLGRKKTKIKKYDSFFNRIYLLL